MKAEERKELKSNTLVKTMEHVGKSLKEGPSRRTAVTLGIIGLVVLLVVIWRIASNVSASRNSERWEKLATVDSVTDLESFVKDNGDTIQGRAAQLQVARDKLTSGLDQIYNSSKAAETDLKEAAASLDRLAGDFKSTPVLAQECLLGAAQAYEALGKFKEAADRCEQLKKTYKDSPLARDAATLLDRIEKRKAELEKVQAELNKK
jgi:hypothetical protein